MKKYLISFATNDFNKNITLKKYLATNICGFDKFIIYEPNDLDKKFYKSHAKHFSFRRGYGYFIWKFYIILDALKKINNGDFLFYLDSGAIFINNVNSIISAMNEYSLDFAGFGSPLLEINFTKRELFDFLNLDFDVYSKKNQLIASCLPMFKTKNSINFYQNCFELGSNLHLINDELDIYKQHPDFIDHRHDQSIFSLSYQMLNYTILKDPTQFGNHPEGYSGYKFFKKPDDSNVIQLPNRRYFRINEYPGSYSNLIYQYRTHNIYFCYARYMLAILLKKTFLNNIVVR